MALLDEVKRLEDDNRTKMHRLYFRQQDNYRCAKLETNPGEPFIMYPGHEMNHRQFQMFRFESGGNSIGQPHIQ